jgi:hypothetical protein
MGFKKAVNSCVTSTGQVNLPSTAGRQRGSPAGALAELESLQGNFILAAGLIAALILVGIVLIA